VIVRVSRCGCKPKRRSRAKLLNSRRAVASICLYAQAVMARMEKACLT